MKYNSVSGWKYHATETDWLAWAAMIAVLCYVGTVGFMLWQIFTPRGAVMICAITKPVCGYLKEIF